MEGEKEYTRAIYEVVQEIIRQLLQHDGKPFTYSFQPKLEISKLEQSYMIRALARNGVIKFKRHMVSDIFMHNEGIEEKIYNRRRFVITASKEKLEQYARGLKVSDEGISRTIEQVDQAIMCTLRMNDRDMMLKVGDYPEQKIGQLLEGRPLYRLMAALQGKPPGVVVTSAEVLPNIDNLWQLFAKSKYSYLAPFFQHSNRRIAFYPTVELSRNQVLSILSKVTDKYRQNADSIAKSL